LKVHLPENPEIPVLEVPVQEQENRKQEEEEEAKTGPQQEMNPPPPPALTLLNFESLNF
jgi:hypothetical protein